MAKSVIARSENSQFQLTIVIPKEKVEAAYKKVVEDATKEVEVPGFRKGQAPADKAEAQLDKDKLYQRVVQVVVPEVYVEAIKEHDLKPIVSPKIQMVKAREGEDWEVRATACEMPQVNLGDYKEKLKGLLAKGKIWTPREQETGDKKQETVTDPAQSPAPSDEGKTQPQPPQGESREEKEQQVLKWVLENVEVKLPVILIEDETNRLLSQFVEQMQKLGLNLDQYLQSMGKSGEQVRSDYQVRAIDNLKLEFALGAITKDLKVEAKPEEVDQLVATVKDEKMKEELKKDAQRRSLEISIRRRKTLEELVKLAG
jgi:trigger factor